MPDGCRLVGIHIRAAEEAPGICHLPEWLHCACNSFKGPQRRTGLCCLQEMDGTGDCSVQEAARQRKTSIMEISLLWDLGFAGGYEAER